MPLQYEQSASSKKKAIIYENSSAKKSRKNEQEAENRRSPTQPELHQARKLQENCPSRFNYMDKVEK